ncbi:unnamed protein product [Protopolystoma xenopodis]|uniref:Uncharacterized protein n=1 Tax=Protopolystoma xenopodis TaxID=117903 RepID=A0A448XJE2_9PLAT|nr:unnamed protein product [Protopolystoma xenopodis]
MMSWQAGFISTHHQTLDLLPSRIYILFSGGIEAPRDNTSCARHPFVWDDQMKRFEEESDSTYSRPDDRHHSVT